MPNDLIRCGDHKLAPWSIVCVHLSSGQSRDWVRLESDNPEVEYDFLCPACAESMDGRELTKEDLQELQAICIHCVRELRAQYDPTFSDDTC